MPRLRRHPADIGQLRALLDALEADALAGGLPRDSALRLCLLAEELFMNSVLHGFASQRGGCVAWGLWLQPGKAELRYADNGPAWRPPAQAAAPGRAGGYGLPLLGAMTSRLVRRRFKGWNLVHLDLPVRNASCLPTTP